MIKRWLAHPLTHGLDIDDPQVTHLRRRIILEKPFLRHIYEEWYQLLAAALPSGHAPVLEVGSGAGFLQHSIPGLIPSEVFPCPDIALVLDGCALPLADSSLRAIVMTDVLHHIAAPRQFLREASRCVHTGGRLIMIEPWVTAWSRVVYTHLHHEPFRPESCAWEFPRQGPLSGANGALPWMIFARDRALFAREFPEWHLVQIDLLMPFRYLVSGGVSLRNLMPGWSFACWRSLEQWLAPWNEYLAMFACIVLEKTSRIPAISEPTRGKTSHARQ